MVMIHGFLQFLKSGHCPRTDPFVDGQSAISPFLGGYGHDTQFLALSQKSLVWSFHTYGHCMVISHKKNSQKSVLWS